MKDRIFRMAGRTRPHFLAIFCLLVIAAVGAYFILMMPRESARTVLKAVSFFKTAKTTPAGLHEFIIDPTSLDGKRAFNETAKFVAIGPRISGTDGSERAAKYIATRLKEFRMDAIIDEFKELTPNGEKTFRNVMAESRGSDDFVVILLSHYDTKSGISEDFIGANDSGSSTGLLLEMARLLKTRNPSGPTILMAFLDGEECSVEYGAHDGLHGSKHLVRTIVRNGSFKKVSAVILMDMVGDANLDIGIPRNSSPSLISLIFECAARENARLKFSLAEGNITDDHVPFIQVGMRAVDIIDFNYGSAPGKNDYWHSSQDTMDKLSAESLQVVGRVVIRALNSLKNHKLTSSTSQ